MARVSKSRPAWWGAGMTRVVWRIPELVKVRSRARAGSKRWRCRAHIGQVAQCTLRRLHKGYHEAPIMFLGGPAILRWKWR